MIASDDVAVIVAASIAKEDDREVSFLSVLPYIKDDALRFVSAILCGIVEQSNDDSC